MNVQYKNAMEQQKHAKTTTKLESKGTENILTFFWIV